MIKAALLDMNGTLFNDEPFSHQAFATVLGSMGLELSLTAYKKFFAGKTTAFGLRTFLEYRHKEHEYDIPTLVEAVNAVYDQIADAPQLIDGVEGFMGELAIRGVTMALVTSASRKEAESFLGANSQVRAHIRATITGDDVRNCKPDPEALLMAAEVMGVGATECVMVGDGPSDVKAAKAVHMLCIAVTNSHTSRELRGADFIVPALTPELAIEIVDN